MACMALMASSLSSGSRLPRTSVMPASRAIACAVAWLSPVSMTGVMPIACSSATACFDDGLMVSATAKSASAPASVGEQADRPASVLMGAQRRFELSGALLAILDQAMVAEHIDRAVDFGLDAASGQGGEVPGLDAVRGQAGSDGLRHRMVGVAGQRCGNVFGLRAVDARRSARTTRRDWACLR